MDVTFTALVWVAVFCTQPMYIHPDGKCDDGSDPHKLEIRLLDGKRSSSGQWPAPSFTTNEIDDMKVERLFVLLRDDQEIASLPASLISAEEARRLLQAAWPQTR